MISPSFFDFVSQVAHFCATYGIVLTLMLFTRLKTKKHFFWRMGIVGVLIVIYAGVHEFYYDPRYENAATRGSDTEDFCFLVAGAAVAELIAYFKLVAPVIAQKLKAVFKRS